MQPILTLLYSFSQLFLENIYMFPDPTLCKKHRTYILIHEAYMNFHYAWAR